jgi:nucleotide-binding universal stress UspA family protein
MKRLLVPTDFSPRSRLAITHATELAQRLGATVELMHAFETPVNPAPEVAALTPLPAELRAEIDRELEREAATVREAGVTCEVTALWGDPRKIIARQATERRADMIVMATHGRTGLGHALLGSVTEAVIRRAPCPVVVVPGALARKS